MNAAISRFLRTLNIYYDKIIALVVLLLLLLSLVTLLIRIGTDQAEHERFTRELHNLTPLHPNPSPPDTEVFDIARTRLRDPYQISAWDRPVMSPERRVHCVNCERPIVYDADVCPFCHYDQPEDAAPPTDWDGDGIPDAWELEHGLDPRDPTDADMDFDGDGFTNIEHYIFDTDPNDPASFPSPWVRLRLEGIESEPFDMLFMAVSRLGERQVFQVNLRDGSRSYWVEMGETIGGFTLHSYEFKEERRGSRIVDVSVLTLKRGDLEIPLIRGQVTPHQQHRARLIFEIDESQHTVSRGSELELRGHRYQIMEIDPQGQRALLRDRQGETLWIERTSLSARKIRELRS